VQPLSLFDIGKERGNFVNKLLLWICVFSSIAGFADEDRSSEEMSYFWNKKKEPEAPPPQPVQPVQTKAATTSDPALINYWKTHSWASLGYRHDRQRFDEFGSHHILNSRTSLKNRNTVNLTMGWHTTIKDFILGIHGGYGWLINGNFKYLQTGNNPNEPLFHRQYDLGAGYNANVQGSIGWECKIVKCGNIKFSVIPAGGYRYFHFMNFPSEMKRFNIPDTHSFALGSYPKVNEQDWYGPYLEARIRFKFWKNAQWDLYYQYQHTEFRAKSKFDMNIYNYTPAQALSLAQFFQISSYIRSTSAQTQLGGSDIRIHYTSGWTFGLYFEGASTWTRSAQMRLKEVVQTTFPTPITTTTTRIREENAAVYWVGYWVSIYSGYKF